MGVGKPREEVRVSEGTCRERERKGEEIGEWKRGQ